MPILQTHRRGLFLLERSRVRLAEGRAVHVDADPDATEARAWNIPSLNTTAVMLGQGCSITQPAARRLADDDVLLAFVGTGGTPLICASQSYRPGDRLQRWVSLWPDPVWRLSAAKHLQRARLDAIAASWPRVSPGRFSADPTAATAGFAARVDGARDNAALMGAEGDCTRALYREASRAAGVTWHGRSPGERPDLVNALLDHGNYLAYGLAGVALWALGIPPSLPVLHGRSTSGGLVFDLADVVKDALVLPVAFLCAAETGISGSEARARMVEQLHGAVWLDPNGALGLMFRVTDELLSVPATTSTP